jgi:hypothetical protein
MINKNQEGLMEEEHAVVCILIFGFGRCKRKAKGKKRSCSMGLKP